METKVSEATKKEIETRESEKINKSIYDKKISKEFTKEKNNKKNKRKNNKFLRYICDPCGRKTNKIKNKMDRALYYKKT